MIVEKQILLKNPTSQYRCVVAPVAEGHKRPVWSVMIPTYNCADYLKETLSSVLAQDLGKEVMEIWVVDDHSTKDDPEEVVKMVGKGRVNFYRQAKNIGHTGNFATCLNLSKGYLVHQLHGDDKVKPGFYTKMQSIFEANPQLGAAFCRHDFIDAKGALVCHSHLEQEYAGELTNWLKRMAQVQIIQTPSMVVKRSVYEKLGGFDQRLKYCEDWEMWVRIAAHYPIGYEPEILAQYREHNSSNTSRTRAKAETALDLLKAINLMYEYLDKSEREKIRKKARENCANILLKVAHALCFEQKNREGARIQIMEALRLYKSPAFVIKSARLYRHLILW
jgi:glycosyltransferase involved in cell wall biosynthesis